MRPALIDPDQVPANLSTQSRRVGFIMLRAQVKSVL